MIHFLTGCESAVSLRIGTKETHNILHLCRLYWDSTVKSHFFFNSIFKHFLFYTNLRVWVFKCKLQIKVGGWGPDSYSETSQVSCLSPISFFNRREATILLELGQRKTTVFFIGVGVIRIVHSRRKSIGPGLSNLCTQSVLTRQKLATCYAIDKKCQKTFTSFFLNSSIL